MHETATELGLGGLPGDAVLGSDPALVAGVDEKTALGDQGGGRDTVGADCRVAAHPAPAGTVAAEVHGPPAPVDKAILTVDELAEFLRLNRKTVYEAIDRGEIPGVRRIGESYRIHRATVLAWFASSQGRVSRSRRY